MDTTYSICDTIVAKMNEITVNLQPAEQCKCACWADVIITFIICGMIAAIAIVGCIQFIKWKKEQLDKENKQKEVERKWKIEDSNREQIAKLHDKELEFKKDVHLAKDRLFTHEQANNDDPYLAAIRSIIEELNGNKNTNKDKNNDEKK